MFLKLNFKCCAGGGGRFRRQARAVQISYVLRNCKSQTNTLDLPLIKFEYLF